MLGNIGHWWRKICTRRKPGVRPRLEALEDRLALSASPAFPVGVAAALAVPAPALLVASPSVPIAPHADIVYFNPLLTLPGRLPESQLVFSPSGGGGQAQDDWMRALTDSDKPGGEQSESDSLDIEVWSTPAAPASASASEVVLAQVAEALVAVE